LQEGDEFGGGGREVAATASGPAKLAAERRVDWNGDDVAAAFDAHPRGEGDAAATGDHRHLGVLAAHFDARDKGDAERLRGLVHLGAEAEAGHREQEVRVADNIANGDARTVRPWVVGREDQEHVFFEEGVHIEAGIREREDDDGEVGRIVEEAGDGIVGAEHFDADAYARVGLAQGGEGAGDEVVGDGFGGAERDAPARAQPSARERRGGSGDVIEHPPGAIGEHEAGFGWDDASADAVEQGLAQLAFEEAYLLADRRLGNVFDFGGAGHAAGADDGAEVAKLVQFHPDHAPEVWI